MLARTANGFGAVALAALLAEDGRADPVREPVLHHPAKAKAVIFLYMDGGPSQVDTFDYKPLLEKHHGKDPHKVMEKVEPTQFANVGRVMQSHWKFKQRGQSGMWVSDLFPHVAAVADDLAVVRSVVSKFPEHTSANYFLHTGAGVQGRPSWGAWAGYGLGTGNKDLPTFIVLNGGLIPPGGLDNFNSGFLPAAYQGSVFRAGNPPVANIARLEKTSADQMVKRDLMRKLDALGQKTLGPADEVESAIANYETAYRMQTAVPELMDTSKETTATKRLYGLDSTYAPTVSFGTQCLVARRLVERGAKFIELTCPSVGSDRWDQHSDMKNGHEKNARATDQPVAALLTDLKARGLLKDTLVVWGGEFGRTPFAQGGDGRDHNQYGFTMWLAGGGTKAGTVYGETDEWGYKVVRDRVEMHDLHATMLHLLGIDHKKLTFRFGGRDMRLTDVHGELVTGILA
ncbi:hypothetical protein FRUB_01289 [Fimbriiglobus ruber]|uniref:Sulfatase n=2 Tax=Fimbriiglobus ruber TaxID=1908690 RepID=A0A225E2F3_9BACT|nr:hypothetical protein FRUB_01289 [Fimbriiglobus ruber]